MDFKLFFLILEYAFVSVTENGDHIITIPQNQNTDIDGNLIADLHQDNANSQVLMLQTILPTHQTLLQELPDGTQVSEINFLYKSCYKEPNIYSHFL